MRAANPLLRLQSSFIRAILASVLCLLALILVLRPMLLGIFQSSFGAQSDFALAIYYPVRALLDGVNPYDRASYLSHYPVRVPFAPYLPSILLLHLPLGFLSVAAATIVYLLTSIGFTLLLAFLSLRLAGLKVSSAVVLLVAAGIVVSRPGRENLLLVQVTLEVVLTTYLTLYYAHSAPRRSGLALSLTFFKPTYGVPLAVLLLLRGHRRALVYATLFGVLLNLPVIAILIYQAGGIHPFLEQIVTSFSRFQIIGPAMNPVLSPHRVDAVALFARWAGRMPGMSGELLVASSVLGMAGIALNKGRRCVDGQVSLLEVGLICTAVLLFGYHQQYDLLLLTFPFVGVASRRLSQCLDPPLVRSFMPVLFTFLFFNYIASDLVLRRFNLLAGEALVRNPLGLILASLNGVALLLLFLSFVSTLLAASAPVVERT
jgi:Glycosyltransferase family 87